MVPAPLWLLGLFVTAQYLYLNITPFLHWSIQTMDQPQLRRGDSSKPAVRYNPVPIGGPDRPPVTQTPSPGTIYASSPGDRESYPDRSLRRALETSAIKREAGIRDDSEYPPEPPSAVTDHTELSSTTYPDADARRDSSREGDADVDGEPQKKKQKRNKPTLSCYECVERKTKVGISISP